MTARDGHGLRRLAEQSGKHFQTGVIVYAGTSALPTSDRRIQVVPLTELWTN